MDNLDQAAELAYWLIGKGKQKNVAVIIGCNKFKVPFSFRAVVSKRVTELRNHKGQTQMFAESFQKKHEGESDKQFNQWLRK